MAIIVHSIGAMLVGAENVRVGEATHRRFP